jgi:excisionase family DNA binding protein
MAGAALPSGHDPTETRHAHGILTVVEVARELRCSKSHVHHLIEGRVRGTPPLPSIWLGRRRLVRRSSLEEWIKANEHGAVV